MTAKNLRNFFVRHVSCLYITNCLTKQDNTPIFSHVMRNSLKAYLYILPALLLSLVFVYSPFIWSVVSSFFNVRLDGSFASPAGLRNYVNLLTDSIYWESLANTFRFIILFYNSIIS